MNGMWKRSKQEIFDKKKLLVFIDRFKENEWLFCCRFPILIPMKNNFRSFLLSLEKIDFLLKKVAS